MPLPLTVDQLHVADVEAQVGKPNLRAFTADWIALPGGDKGNVDGVIPLTAGHADQGNQQRGNQTSEQDQVAILLTSTAPSSLAESSPSSLSGVME